MFAFGYSLKRISVHNTTTPGSLLVISDFHKTVPRGLLPPSIAQPTSTEKMNLMKMEDRVGGDFTAAMTIMTMMTHVPVIRGEQRAPKDQVYPW